MILLNSQIHVVLVNLTILVQEDFFECHFGGMSEQRDDYSLVLGKKISFSGSSIGTVWLCVH